MSRLLALEWDAREIRLAVANARGDTLVIERAMAIPVAARGAGEEGEAEIGPLVSSALAVEQLGARVDTLVAVGRTSIELRLLSLPPAPPEELPDLVRFQAMRNFAGIGEDWPLDFVPLSADQDGSLRVLAACISPDIVRHIQDTCQACGVSPKRLILRPFAAASLLRHANITPSGECRLVVDILADEADLTVVADGEAVFMRTVRVPASQQDEAQIRTLTGEIRRTIGAAQSQLGGRRIDKATLCGDASEHVALREAIVESLGMEVDAFDPFSAVDLAPGLGDRLPDNHGRFAPLLGMLVAEAAGDEHAIDFLHPRRRPVPPSRKGRYVLAAASAAVVLLALLILGWLHLRSLDAEIARLQEKSDGYKAEVDRSDKLTKQMDAIDDWEDGDVTWLDGMVELARRLPSGDEVMLTDITVSAATVIGTTPGGQLSMNGVLKDRDRLAQLEEDLRYNKNVVSSTGTTHKEQGGDYPFSFQTHVAVVPDVREEGRPLGRPQATEAQPSPSANAAPSATQSPSGQPAETERAESANSAPADAPKPDAKG